MQSIQYPKGSDPFALSSIRSLCRLSVALTVLGLTAVSALADAPLITVQPANQTNCAGTHGDIQCDRHGTDPLSYQWYFNETSALADATNATVSLANAQAASAGKLHSGDHQRRRRGHQRGGCADRQSQPVGHGKFGDDLRRRFDHPDGDDFCEQSQLPVEPRRSDHSFDHRLPGSDDGLHP